MAQMLRDDLAQARSAWLAEVEQDPEELQRREESDFLLVKNEEGETLDFHRLRHTCGAWLAMTGAHPKVVQTVMRHSTITLTMDTYGHLFPSTESNAVDRLGEMKRRPDVAPAEPVDNCLKPRSTTRSSQDAQGSETNRRCATHCDSDGKFDDPRSERNGLKTRARCDVVRSRTMQCLPLAPLAQLAEQLTLNQRTPAENPEDFADSHQRAALGAAVDVNASATYVDSCPNLAAAHIAQAWPYLPPHVQESINLLVDAALSSRLAEGGQS